MTYSLWLSAIFYKCQIDESFSIGVKRKTLLRLGALSLVLLYYFFGWINLTLFYYLINAFEILFWVDAQYFILSTKSRIISLRIDITIQFFISPHFHNNLNNIFPGHNMLIFTWSHWYKFNCIQTICNNIWLYLLW